MNCINHPEQPRVAFCQQCGKPLCEACTRSVGSAVFCEPCLQARVAPPTPATGYTPGPATTVPPLPETSASPFLAGVLGFIPGVGAMYNGQFVKAMVHIAVFALLCALSHHNAFFIIFVFGWEFYQVFDAVFTARARRDGDPLPDPFGLLRVENEVGARSRMNSPYPPYVPPTPPYVPPVPPTPGVPYQSAQVASGFVPPAYRSDFPPAPPRSNVPVGAVVLIGLGLLFLLGSMNVFNIRLSHIFLPFFLIGLGVWLYCRRVFEYPAMQVDDDPVTYHRYYRVHALRSLRAPAFLVVTGTLWLLDSLHILRWGNHAGLGVGAYLMLFGILILVERVAGSEENFNLPPAATMPPTTPTPTAPDAPVEPEAPLTHRNTEGQE